ncbi:MAG: VOC family protein [Cytophagaceae bacterium]|nr:VOC family protein [Gemmatimonadaceae bacterium]
MARVSTYLNFARSTEQAFEFYRSVFGGEFVGGIKRYGDMPPSPDHPMAEGDGNLVLHVELPILGGFFLMGSDAPESMGHNVKAGNNVYINLEPDSREEADRLFQALSAGGAVEMPIQDMFWGAYFGSLIDKFGTKWMVNHTPTP